MQRGGASVRVSTNTKLFLGDIDAYTHTEVQNTCTEDQAVQVGLKALQEFALERASRAGLHR